MDGSTPGFPVLHHLPEFAQTQSIELVMPSNHFVLCHPLLLLLWIFLSIRVFSNESALHLRWPQYWSFSLSISLSNEYSGLISFRIDCFDVLAVQGTLKSLLQQNSSKTSILWCSAFCMVQISYPYMTTEKTMALTMQTFVDKVMSLLFNMLSRFVIAFLPRSLLISWMHLPSAVILEPPRIKSVTVSMVSPSIYHEVMGLENWCFCTVVLEKTLESPWDCKEIKPVHPKGNQSWIFIGRTDVEAEMPILWPPDAKNWVIGKDPDAGKDWRQKEKGMAEDEMVGWHHRLNGHEFE